MLYFKEAKIRIIYIFISFIFTWLCSYFFCNQLIYILALPLKYAYVKSKTQDSFHLIFTEVTELFLAQLKISLIITFIFFLPILIYQF